MGALAIPVDTSGYVYDFDVLNEYGVAAQAAISHTKAFDGQSFYHSKENFVQVVEWLSAKSSHLATFAQMAQQAASVKTPSWQLMDTSRVLEFEFGGFAYQVSELAEQFSLGHRLDVSNELRALAAEALDVIDRDAQLDAESIASWAEVLARDSVDRCD